MAIVVSKASRIAAVSGIMGAAIVALSFTGLGYITFIQASLTFLPVFVVFAAILEGPVSGIIAGLVFGLSSLLQAAIAPRSAFDPVFVNPLLSVLPRLPIGLVAYFAYRLFPEKLRLAGLAAAGVAGSLTNTVLVLLMLVLLGLAPFELALTVFVSNGLLEAALGGLACTAILGAWFGLKGGRSKLGAE
jgi:uncharacterized membrane protein